MSNLVPAMKENKDLMCYFCTKHSWKGKYKRVFSIGTLGITTYNPQSLEVTNQWAYSDFINISITSKCLPNEFVICMKKGTKKVDQMRFSSDHRADILTEALRFRSQFSEKPQTPQRFNGFKYHWSEQRIPVILQVDQCGLDQVDQSTGKIVCTFDFKDLECLVVLSDYPGGLAIVYGGFGRLHIFSLQQRDMLVKAIQDSAMTYVGILLKLRQDPITFEQALNLRMGKYSSDEHQTSYTEFSVQKFMEQRHKQPVRRTLCLSETCLIERDPATYHVVTCRPLCDVAMLIRDMDNPQRFTVSYVRGQERSYTSTDRDALLATVLDGSRASGNRDVHVVMLPMTRGFRFGPSTVPVDEEVESQHLKFLKEQPVGMTFSEAVQRFNANVGYAGLLHAVTGDRMFAENKEKLIKGALEALVVRSCVTTSASSAASNETNHFELEAEFHALRRLLASKAGFKAFTAQGPDGLPILRENLGQKVINALQRNHDGVIHAALDTINALMTPMHDNSDLQDEYNNKKSLMSSNKFLERLLSLFQRHIDRGSGALVISAMLDFLTFALCAPYSDTTEGNIFDSLLNMLAERGRSIFKLFQHPSMAVVKGAGLVMKAIIEEGDAETAASMQHLALSEGALPLHLLTALYTQSADQRLLTQRQLSRHLVGLWITGNDTARRLLNRVLPYGLLHYLDSKETPALDDIDRLHTRNTVAIAAEQASSRPDAATRAAKQLRHIEKQVEGVLLHWREKIGLQKRGAAGAAGSNLDQMAQQQLVVLRRRRQRIRAEANFAMFYYQFTRDHARPNLIWNYRTREELREALEAEIRGFNVDRDLGGGAKQVAWNHQEFEVVYKSLEEEIRIGEYFLRLLLEEDERVRSQRASARGSLTYSLTEPSNESSSVATVISSSPSAKGLDAIKGSTETSENKTLSNDEVEVDGVPTKTTSAVINDHWSLSEEELGLTAIYQPKDFLNDLYHKFLLTPKVNMKCMCLQAMTIVYGRCHSEIGPFNDTKYIVGMLERCSDRLERDRLVQFIDRLVQNQQNAKEVMDASGGAGLRVLVDLLTLAHLHVSRAYVPSQTNQIEAGSEMRRDGEKEWYYGNTPKERHGPLSFAEICDLYADETITSSTRCWAQGMDGWRRLADIPQLKWRLVATGQAVLNESDLAVMLLNILRRIADYYPSVDELGSVVRPLPRVKQGITSPMTLPHVVQLLLTFDPVIVVKVAELMNNVMLENPYISRFYLTGVFFFLLMYNGSNVLPIARLLKYTHLQQAFRSEELKGSDILQRSILGHILPEAMLCYLEYYPPERFAQIFLGEFDTPEAIWNAEMRNLMINKLAAHLSEFSPRLMSNTRALYQYCPVPVIDYPQLQNELFCNVYYLRHLCDTTKFSDWPIREPVKLLKDVLEAWKKEVEKKPPSMTLDEAYASLELETGVGLHDEAKLRKSYFRLAQKYHPDRNPEGREKFEEANAAYEFLCSRSKIGDGPDPKNIVLILRTQSILFSRYTDVLRPYKYAGYPMLIKTIRMETLDDQLFTKSSPLLSAAAELCYHTVNTSPLNAEEMRRENGIEALHEAFDRCVSVVGRGSKPSDTAVDICANIARFFSVAAQFSQCRDCIQEQPLIVKNLLRVLFYKHLSELCSLVTECASAFCVDFWLQTCLFQHGILYHILPYLFDYDYTLEEGGIERSAETHKQEACNRLAQLGLVSCSRLAGVPQLLPAGNSQPEQKMANCPDNPAVKNALAAMLTPYVVRQMGKIEPTEILKLLNGNTESPYLIWDNSTRAELLSYLNKQQEQLVSTGECDSAFGTEFVFSAHAKELIIGDVFVRVYNVNPSFPLDNAKGFAIDLLHYLENAAQYLHSLLAMQKDPQQDLVLGNKEQRDRMPRIESALEALRNVIRNNPGVEIQCIGHFTLLFALLRLAGWKGIQMRALEVVSSVTSNQECVNDIAASDVLVYLILLLELLPEGRLLCVDTLHPLMNVQSLVKEASYRGALLYLLDLFASATNAEVRTKTAELLSKMMADKLYGPRIRIILSKFLPPLFMDAMRDAPDQAVNMFESAAENPEFIWTDESREVVCREAARLKRNFHIAQLQDPKARWNLPADYSVQYTQLEGELTVSGVYLRLFVANPLWVVRRPKEFLADLLETWTSMANNATGRTDSLFAGEKFELVTQALCSFLQAQPSFLDQVPQLGYVPAVLNIMARNEVDAVLRGALLILLPLSANQLCVQAMATVSECVTSVKRAMELRPDQLALACHALHRIFEMGTDELVGQSLRCGLISYLLGLLETGLERVDNPGAAKAQIVNALKAMQKSLQWGEEVSLCLAKSSVWKDYKDQSHDLFIDTSQHAGYLTAGTPQVAGYLMSGSSSSASGSSFAGNAVGGTSSSQRTATKDHWLS